ncbi:MAG: TetR/AcrR family transcriptional regulator [Verrucomicrobiota bacterium JB022]|nr:TetR/AcrR family transcriptional regulator [Verrucomicrobiota bacterium JB022]
MAPTSTSEARERILSAATRLFYTKGYRATGINEVIAEADVAKATLYHHYPSKDDLGADWLRRKMTEVSAMIDDIAGRDLDRAARVDALFEHLERNMADPEYRGCPFCNISTEMPDSDHPLNAIACEHKRNLREGIRLLLQPQTQDEALPEERFTFLSDALYLLFLGASSLDLCGDRVAAARTARRTAHCLLQNPS